MILYFTGTGNSLHIAKALSNRLGDELLSINEKIKKNDNRPIKCDERLVFVLPTYAWRIPTVVEQWIKTTSLEGARSAWLVMTCGDEIGNADEYNRELVEEKGIAHMGTVKITMPENYIAMFDAPSEDETKKIIEAADAQIDAIAAVIAENASFSPCRVNAYGKIMSSAVNSIFYKLFVKAKAFRADDRCIGCGRCVELCPLNNITLSGGKPVWSTDCTHCMACISYCPTQAIEYGKKSVGKRRYHCD